MTRRELMVGMALQSVYIPRAQVVEDRGILQDFMDEFSFVELVSGGAELRITHIPVVLDRGAGKFGTLYGHVSRHNPQAEGFDGQHPFTVVFRGPDAYISPTWYAGGGAAVPTWNFAAVHASGRPGAITDQKALRGVLERLIGKFERPGTGYSLSRVPEEKVSEMMGGIVGFAMEIERLEGKFKLGQERSAADREGVLRGLRGAGAGRSMYKFTAAFYRNR